MVERHAYTIGEFCDAYRLKPPHLYAMWRRGEGPRKTKVGSRTFISIEAAEAWWVKTNQQTPQVPDSITPSSPWSMLLLALLCGLGDHDDAKAKDQIAG